MNFVWDAAQEPSTPAWEANFERLLEFVEQKRHALVPKRYPPDPTLGQWVAKQRTAFKAEQARLRGDKPKCTNRISQNQIARLDEVGFVWDFSVSAWEAKYEAFFAFVAEHGHARVSQRYKADPSLAVWVANQRKARKAQVARAQGQTSNFTNRISAEQVARLDRLGFVWSIPKSKGRASRKRKRHPPAKAAPICRSPVANDVADTEEDVADTEEDEGDDDDDADESVDGDHGSNSAGS